MSAFLLLVLIDVSIGRQRADEFDELIGDWKIQERPTPRLP